MAKRCHQKQNVGLARRVTRTDGPTFLPLNTLARPAGSSGSRQDKQNMRERWFTQSEHALGLLARATGREGVNFFLILTLSKVDSALKVTLLPGVNFPPMRET